MALWLKQSTSTTIQFGPFLDKTDGVTLEVGLATALDNATTGIRLTKNGATQVDRNSATAPAYTAMGLYTVNLSTTDTNTLGNLRIIFEEAATCLPVWQDFMIVPANVYDSFVLGTDALDVSLTQVNGAAQTATLDTIKAETVLIVADTGELQTDDYPTSIAALQTDLDTLTAGVTLTAASVDLIWDEPMVAHGTADTSGLVMNEWQDAGRLDAILDIIAADVVNVDGYNLATQIGTAGAGLTNIGTVATVTNVTNLHASAATAANLATVDTNVDNLNLGIIYGVTSGTPSTTSTDTDLSGYVTGELVGRVIVFTGGTADGQAATILTYTSTNGVVTFAALTTAPAASDTFKIV